MYRHHNAGLQFYIFDTGKQPGKGDWRNSTRRKGAVDWSVVYVTKGLWEERHLPTLMPPIDFILWLCSLSHLSSASRGRLEITSKFTNVTNIPGSFRFYNSNKIKSIFVICVFYTQPTFVISSPQKYLHCHKPMQTFTLITISLWWEILTFLWALQQLKNSLFFHGKSLTPHQTNSHV